MTQSWHLPSHQLGKYKRKRNTFYKSHPWISEALHKEICPRSKIIQYLHQWTGLQNRICFLNMQATLSWQRLDWNSELRKSVKKAGYNSENGSTNFSGNTNCKSENDKMALETAGKVPVAVTTHKPTMSQSYQSTALSRVYK